MNLLLIEDNQMNYEMLTDRLERKGFSVSLATNGKEGLTKAKELAPDIILMDMSLPLMDGWAVTRALKRDPRYAGIPIIALTAHARPEDRAKCLEAGCNDYHTKPINFSLLIKKIESLTNERVE